MRVAELPLALPNLVERHLSWPCSWVSHFVLRSVGYQGKRTCIVGFTLASVE